ncbi:Carbohydrate sulfotransferase, partial [Gryllus bimaculatus]
MRINGQLQKSKIFIGAGIICSFLLILSNVLWKFNRHYFDSKDIIITFTDILNLETFSQKVEENLVPKNDRRLELYDNDIEGANIDYFEKNICKKNSFMNYKVSNRNFLVNYPKKLLYCWIHKVASTTVTSLFSSLAGRYVKKNYYREINILAAKSHEELENIIHNTSFIKFLVVRHPFERLVSAFRDRIADNSRFTTQAWLYGPRILAKRRLNYTEMFDTNNGFVLKIIPTFQEFITWLISTPPTKYDVHWIRYNDHCLPCKIHYNVIIKLESALNGEEGFKNVTKLKKLKLFSKHLQKTGVIKHSRYGCCAHGQYPTLCNPQFILAQQLPKVMLELL